MSRKAAFLLAVEITLCLLMLLVGSAIKNPHPAWTQTAAQNKAYGQASVYSPGGLTGVMPSRTPTVEGADLAVDNVYLSVNFGASNCLPMSEQVGIVVMIKNIGNRESENFVVSVNGKEIKLDRLAPHVGEGFWSDNFINGVNEVIIDPHDVIPDTNRDNNVFKAELLMPTHIPATCTTTPTFTPGTVTPSWTPTIALT